jgi:putative ATP-binding cassette transporter
VVLDSFSAEILPGEHVLIGGDPGSAVKLFKVVAGLWPWGKGTVSLPSDATVFFMPQRPYMPIGSLRAVLAYPSAIESYSDEALKSALLRVGLGHLSERLRDSDTWEQVLSAGEQQRLGFARLLLHRPRWVFLQEATDAVDPESERRLMQILIDEFPAATIMTVGFHPDLEAYHQRRLILVPTAAGQMLIHETRQDTPPPADPPKGWPGRLFSPMRRRNERRSLTAGLGKRGDWRD